MTKVIAVVSGKGGVGKTTTVVNVASALRQQGIKTAVVDGNVLTPHVALHLGVMSPPATINDFLQKKTDLWSTIYHHDSGVDFLLASPSYQEGKAVPSTQLGKLLGHLEGQYDMVLVDCPSGLGDEVSTLLKYADEALIVAQPHLASLMDALKVAEVARQENTLVTGIVLNMCHGSKELSLDEVEEIVSLPVIAAIPFDKRILQALHQQEIAVLAYPRAAAPKRFRELGETLLGQPASL